MIVKRLENDKKQSIESLKALHVQNEQIRAQMNRLQNDIKVNQDSLLQTKGYSPKVEAEKSAEVKRLDESIRTIKQKLEELYRGNERNFDVKFKSPTADFDRGLVRGRVLRLVTIREDKYAKALEEVAGGRLYSVIVETEAVATNLLKRGCFRQRETLIPNNKIQARDIPKELTDYVASVTNGKAIHAL